jgi:hypothetical protein
VSLRFHSQPGRAASKRCNDSARSPAVYENAPDSLITKLQNRLARRWFAQQAIKKASAICSQSYWSGQPLHSSNYRADERYMATFTPCRRGARRGQEGRANAEKICSFFLKYLAQVPARKHQSRPGKCFSLTDQLYC